MKSRKLKAILAALSAVAVMATAMTGFAAATTEYDLATGKVIVEETVTAEAGKEVTYLVKSGDQIVYIDQATADATTGAVKFNYKIAGSKIVNLETDVSYGTDGATAVTGGDDELDLYGYANVEGENYTITYNKPITGNGDTTIATIEVEQGYEIESVTIGGVAQVAPFDASYEVANGVAVVVTTKAAYVAPEFTPDDEPVADLENPEEPSYAQVFKVNESVEEYGLMFALFKGAIKLYPAAKTNADGYGAVKIVLPTNYKTTAQTDAPEFKSYYKADGKYYYADGTEFTLVQPVE
ncbi:MAG: hypothetical protein II998_06280 [Clostridia bacterium]|nr:hypothetical protein [Clostridia bacterium]